jgi:hypothetical protein
MGICVAIGVNMLWIVISLNHKKNAVTVETGLPKPF